MSATLLNKIPRLVYLSRFKCRNVRCYSKAKEEDVELPKNVLKNYFSANDQVENGVIYDYKPFKYTCIAGKKYAWCLCGKSHAQPFCDGTHRNIYLKIKQKPIIFSVAETKEYWLCNCKQTSNRPFCDGTHHKDEVQEKNRRSYHN
ncbi:CDGSH iron-sulfur domain-containing protein 3, mitochondrial [Hylaeus volcanicus]|uniref:CDGSH iron-sulfur domain-containing protein 3, mitochondrial n=1 Tax=Hylaeus volcanicus TaxID=313075 RepID=UPI0023B86893|nr:CDGSH iron-sulfur domain-containing protein 3, mitochondrial [Hylaeus volcanicus]